MQQCVVPQNGHIVLQMPPKATNPEDQRAFQLIPYGMKKEVATRLTTLLELSDAQGTQSPVLVEGAQNMVADISAVDGVNFGVEYQLTSDANRILYTKMKARPCAFAGASKFKKDFGCARPLDCETPTCDCKEDQVCRFNQCSVKAFAIPKKLEKYIGHWDGGNAAGAPVKTFVNGHHFKAGSPMIHYCDQVNGEGNFTSYCYDYDDTNSSPYLRSPYKMYLRFFDTQM